VITSPHFLEYVGIVASAVLGVGTVICGILLIVKTVGYLTSSSLRHPRPQAHSAVRRTRRPNTDVYAVMCRAVLEAQASEAKTPGSPVGNESLPVFAQTTKPLDLADATPAAA
jgi:hypothetical protein